MAMKQKKIAEIMTREVEFTEPGATVREAAEKMKRQDLGSLPVCEGGRVIGILTDREMTVGVAAEGRDPGKTTVREIMNPDAATCSEEDDVREVARLMEEKGTHRVLAVNKEGQLVGIVSLGKVARTEDERLAGKVVKTISRARKGAVRKP